MTVRLSTGLRTALAGLLGFAATFEKGIIEIRTGPQPANADAAATGTLLATVTMNSLAFTPGSPTNGLTFASASAGAVAKLGTWSFQGIADGTAGWFRLKGNALDNDAVSTTLPRVDGSTATSGADLDMHIAIKTGEAGTIDGFAFAIPMQKS